MDEAAVVLQQLGFGEYEARAYVALLRRSPLNGYELAKESGLPRANVYGVLQRLEERGAVVRSDATSGARYAPVPVDELVDRLGARYQESLRVAERALGELAVPAAYEDVWNLRGRAAILENARGLIDRAERRLMVAVRPREAAALAPELTRAEARGVDITTLCLEGCPGDCGGCRGRLHRYRVAPEAESQWLILVPDAAEVLAAELGPGDEDALAVRTRQPLLVNLTSWYIRHSIALAAVVGDLGGQLDQLLAPETRALLSSVGPVGNGGWLEHMRRLLARRGPQEATS
jgi:predicted transcriptional regulator